MRQLLARETTTAPTTSTCQRSNVALSHSLRAQYSSLNRAAITRSLIPNAHPSSSALRTDDRGYALFYTNELPIHRRPDGECAAEAVEFATASEPLGDAVEALPPRAAGGVDIHDIHLEISPSHALCAYHLVRVRVRVRVGVRVGLGLGSG